MLRKLNLVLKPYFKIIDQFEQKCPLLSGIIFQLLVGLGVIGTVSAIAFCGASVIWCFYHLVAML